MTEAHRVGAPDPLRIIEAAYTWEPSDALWLARLVEAAAAFSPGDGGGVLGLTVKGTSPVVIAEATAVSVVEPSARAVRSFCEGLPAAHAASFFAPTEFAGNAAWRLARLAKASNTAVEELTNGLRLPQMWGVINVAPHERGVVLAFIASPETRVSADEAFPGGHGRLLGLVGAHLGAAMRLRMRTSSSNDPASAPETDAVLSPSGRVLHATGDARSSRTRESLSEAVLRSERARGRLRRVDSTEATLLWSALVAGRWTVIEATERDGKRYLLARKNPLGAPDILALSERERDVLWLAVQGHSRKYIGYELGISGGMVGHALSGAMRKLRIASRTDLLRKLGVAR